MTPPSNEPTVEQLHLAAAQLRMQIPSEDDFEAYIAAWVSQQRSARDGALKRLADLEAALGMSTTGHDDHA